MYCDIVSSEIWHHDWDLENYHSLVWCLVCHHHYSFNLAHSPQSRTQTPIVIHGSPHYPHTREFSASYWYASPLLVQPTSPDKIKSGVRHIIVGPTYLSKRVYRRLLLVHLGFSRPIHSLPISSSILLMLFCSSGFAFVTVCPAKDGDLQRME